MVVFLFKSWNITAWDLILDKNTAQMTDERIKVKYIKIER